MPEEKKYSVNENNTVSILQAAIDEIAELEKNPLIIRYKELDKDVKGYKKATRNIIVPSFTWRVKKVIRQSGIELPEGFERIATKKDSEKFIYKGMIGTLSKKQAQAATFLMKVKPVAK
tara:strand:+ start:91 stop:447 length:357 start_codon:yes stop_codon:yes gene_type:complete